MLTVIPTIVQTLKAAMLIGSMAIVIVLNCLVEVISVSVRKKHMYVFVLFPSIMLKNLSFN